MGSELVTVYVGQEHQPFSVHKNLIAATGAQFNEMFNSNFIANQRITFEETGTAAFKLFIEYLYGKRIPKVSSHPSAAADSRGNRLRDLCQLYAFIEKYELENEVNLLDFALHFGILRRSLNFFLCQRLPRPCISMSHPA